MSNTCLSAFLSLVYGGPESSTPGDFRKTHANTQTGSKFGKRLHHFDNTCSIWKIQKRAANSESVSRAEHGLDTLVATVCHEIIEVGSTYHLFMFMLWTNFFYCWKSGILTIKNIKWDLCVILMIFEWDLVFTFTIRCTSVDRWPAACIIIIIYALLDRKYPEV